MSDVTTTVCSGCGTESLAASTLIYKYFSLESFAYLWQFQRLLFRPITEWPDAYEGLIYEFLREVKRRRSETLRPAANHLGCCWTLQTDDPRLHDMESELAEANSELAKRGSASMWESYCASGGVRIAVRLEKLVALLVNALPDGQLYHGPVCYKPEDSWRYALGRKDPVCTLFTKRIAFRHEAEYRFIFVPAAVSQHTIDVPFSSFYDFIDEVLISPAVANRRWVARTLYYTVVNGVIRPGRPTNMKNDQQYCRISKLYGDISELYGHGQMD